MEADGFTTPGESRRLEAQADALLKQDAAARGFIKDNGRGFSAYARSIGITTKKTLETTYKHEIAVTLIPYSGEFTPEEKLDALASGMDKIGDAVDDREEA